MTGWGKADTVTIQPPTSEGKAPSAHTLAEVATAAQRWQLTTLVEALTAHPDLAAQVYAALRRSP